MTWEKDRQLKKFDNIEYTYNANGIRTSKKVNGVLHTYALDGTKILRETWGSNTIVPLYDNEDSVCGILYSSVPYYFIKNLQGDVIAIVDKDAETVARDSYDAWGVPTNKQDTSGCQIATINPFRYRSYYYDKEIELYYLQSRYYDADIGRFINGDDVMMLPFAIMNGHNMMCYCSNNPINRYDRYGSFDDSLYGFTWYDGTKDNTGKGFTIILSPQFKKRNKCLEYAEDFLKEYGTGWWIFKNYDGMSKERIAAEIWFHAVVYYIGTNIYILLTILGITISFYNSIYKSSNPATINSKDNREVFFWIVWRAKWLETILTSPAQSRMLPKYPMFK